MVDISEQGNSSTNWFRIYLGILLYTGLLILLLMLFSSRFTE